jgi:hypothetical protein
MTELIYNILNDPKKTWKPYKGAHISIEKNYVKVSYEGTNKSCGLIKRLSTVPDVRYRIAVNAKLIKGDIAHINCETVSNQIERLIPITYFITNNLNEYLIEFIAKTAETTIGILFTNNNQNYELHIYNLSISSVNNDEEDIYKEHIMKYKKLLSKINYNSVIINKIIENNNALAYVIIDSIK